MTFNFASCYWCIIVFCSICSCVQQDENDCVHGSYPPSGRPKVPTYVINLDLPPHERWDELGKIESDKIKNVFNKFKEALLSITSFSKILIHFIDNDLGNMADKLPEPFSDEMKGLAKASNMSLGEVVLFNIFYEVFTVCTSIIAESSNGMLYHARNLDFGGFMGWDEKNHTFIITDALRLSVVNLEWQTSGKTIFKSVNFAGYIGVLTAVKPGAFTFTLNDRFNIDGGFIGILKWILGYRSADWIAFLTRNTLEKATNYKQARDWLSTTEILAPAYFILGGNLTNEACIITRSRNRAVDVWDIGTRNSTWYILETNYDPWKKAGDGRRAEAKKCMDEVTQQNLGFAGLFDVLSSPPVLNKETAYTSLMQVSSGHLETHLQYCPDLC